MKAALEHGLTRMYPELIPADGEVRAEFSYIEEDTPGTVILVAVCRHGKLVSISWEH